MGKPEASALLAGVNNQSIHRTRCLHDARAGGPCVACGVEIAGEEIMCHDLSARASSASARRRGTRVATGDASRESHGSRRDARAAARGAPALSRLLGHFCRVHFIASSVRTSNRREIALRRIDMSALYLT